MATLRSYIFIDQLQPQTMCYLGTWIRGSLPRSNMAAQIIEVAPSLDIEALTDVALKTAEVQGGILVVERQFGYLEIHSRDVAAVKASAEAVIAAMDISTDKAMKPKILAAKIVIRIDPGHAFLINRNKGGSMVLAGETLFVLETEPAAYAILAANEAEKAATIKIVDYRLIGAAGRLYMSGRTEHVERGLAEIERVLAGREGRKA
jgi:ethanolamine utilization microcompartment shell protein EutL